MLGAGGPGTVHGGHPWRESCHWLASLEAAITLVEDHLAMRPDEGYGLGQWHEASPSSWLHKEEAPQPRPGCPIGYLNIRDKLFRCKM